VNLLDFEQRFLELLQATPYKRPHKDTLNVIFTRFPSAMIVCNTPTRAKELYENAKELPRASTTAHILDQHGLRVNGPLFAW
jgi:hypothetical protein